MNLHKNARTCPKSRALMAIRVIEERVPVSSVAEQFGVSRSTVYKWVRRYREWGESGMRDLTSEPRELSHRMGADAVRVILELRRQYRMTALRIANQLQLPRSTVAGVLRRHGMSQMKKLDPPEPVVRFEHNGPGEMVHLDIKKLGRFWRPGHRVTRNPQQDSQGAGWEYVHVCVDDYSRLAYVEVLPDQRQASARAFLDRAVKWFAQLGVRIRRVLTDNGSCYRARTFLNRCRELGIRKKFTRPYRPQTNGKAERFIQTLLAEWAYFRVYKTSIERAAVLPLYLTHYNEHRQHGSLNYKPPISRLPGVHNVVGIHT